MAPAEGIVGELLNLVGLSAGIVLYAMLLAMVVRASRRPSSMPLDPLLLGTAILGLIWNLCALPAYELPKVGFSGPFPYLAAVGFSALGLLPAVVVHSVLRGQLKRVHGAGRRSLALIAYVVSAIAASLHVAAALAGANVPSVHGMRLLTYTFVGLVPPLAIATRGQPGSRRALWIAALAIFAVSALHLSQLHQGDASWPVELLGHHASLPLAVAILYQDYPFALADLFLKRALALLALLALAFAGMLVFGWYSASFARLDPREVGVLVSLWIVSALLYPALRRATAWFVDAVVLRRPDYRSLRAAAARRVHAHEAVAPLLSDVCDLLGPALSARRVTWREWSRGDGDEPATVVTAGPESLTLVPTAEEPRYAIAISGVTGGRRFLSDDLDTIDAIAAIAARRIDALRITQERYAREMREQETEKLAAEAELKALRAQINPHFLFNALTTIGFLIQTAPPRALQTLLRLTSLLRAVLRSETELTTLAREIDMVRAYLDIEHERFEQRLRVRIDVPAALGSLRVPPLVLQPLVENAIKHGVSQKRDGGDVSIEARLDRGAAGHDSLLVLTVRDTGAGADPDALARGRAAGVGLRNVERRLACQYGEAAALRIQSSHDAGTVVEIRLPTGRTSRRSPALQAVGS